MWPCLAMLKRNYCMHTYTYCCTPYTPPPTCYSLYLVINISIMALSHDHTLFSLCVVAVLRKVLEEVFRTAFQQRWLSFPDLPASYLVGKYLLYLGPLTHFVYPSIKKYNTPGPYSLTIFVHPLPPRPPYTSPLTRLS
jgi:hypothetical protein